ncbi:hypothetical protein FRC04_012211 [Tulasnella sp. 424]|nr:hypothetical protein FRC04_012211 [Tulasnella sp. 424]
MATFPNGYANTYGASMATWSMCENCTVRLKHPGHDYCSKACAAQATKQSSSAQAPNAWQHPNSQLDPRGNVYGPGYGIEAAVQEAKSPITPAASAPTTAPTSNSADSDSVGLLSVDLDSEIGEKIGLKMHERWDSGEITLKKVKAIYRVNLPGRIYRRFDFALQCNDFCTVVTTYYGGIPICDIANDEDPIPCNSVDCLVCETLRNAFSNLFSNTPFDDDTLGPGLLTDLNPALAHQAAELNSSQRQQSNTKVVLIQCRVVTRMSNTGPTNPYAGSIDDSGSVFCNRPVAIIPTHLLIYRARAKAKELSRNRTKADDRRSPPAALGRSKTTTDTRRHRREDSSEFEPSRDYSPPTRTVAPPLDVSPPVRARRNRSASRDYSPPVAPPLDPNPPVRATRDLPPPPSNPASIRSPQYPSPAGPPPPGVIPPYYPTQNPLPPPPNPSGTFSPLLQGGYMVPPPGAVPPYYHNPTHNPLPPPPNPAGLLSPVSSRVVVPAPDPPPYPGRHEPPAAPNLAGTFSPRRSGSVIVPAPASRSSRLDPDQRRPPPAAPDLAGPQAPLSPGRERPSSPSLNPYFSPAASNPPSFSSLFSPGHVPGMAELQLYDRDDDATPQTALAIDVAIQLTQDMVIPPAL